MPLRITEAGPLVLAALLHGAALALASTVVQAACRNRLAESSLLEITGGVGAGPDDLIAALVDIAARLLLTSA